jgi:hypothetical protein
VGHFESASLRLAQGDFLLMPATPAFSLGSEPVTGPLLEPGSDPVRHGEPQGEPDFAALGGSFSFERANAPLLLSLLPRQVFIPASQGMTGRLGRTIDLLAEECRCGHPGKDLIVQRMLEVLLVEALRWARAICPGPCRAAGGPARSLAGTRFGGHARRYSRRLDSRASCRDCRHVSLDLLGKVRRGRRLCADRISDPLAHGGGP